jgi:DNA polymerase sigma
MVFMEGILFNYHFNRLHDEIILFTRFIEPRREEHMMRNDIIDKVSSVIKTDWPNVEVIVY